MEKTIFFSFIHVKGDDQFGKQSICIFLVVFPLDLGGCFIAG